MCGICGIFNINRRPVDIAQLGRMMSTLTHRGPDGGGAFIDGHVGLGHRRLSIIDISGGDQPISNEDNTLQVVFNGEIYNFIELRGQLEAAGHKFRTRSDTEVIVHGYEEWGVDCLSRFNGIFAFALWDPGKQRLFVARDHLGVKPIYYSFKGGAFLVASEVKALLAAPYSPAVNIQALAKLFTLRYVPSPDTLFEGIAKLPPGHLMLVDEHGLSTHRYWRTIPAQRPVTSEAELIEEYRDLLQDSVRLQMRSDVPVGLYLSSGVDSAALLSMMTPHASGPVHTFTIGFDGGEATNETDDARRIAERQGAVHTELVLTSGDYEAYFSRYLFDLEEPVGHEPAVAFYFLGALAARSVKVVLCGQGADEPWGGYHRYLGIKLSSAYHKLPSVITRSLAELIAPFTQDERILRGLQSLDEPDMLSRIVKVYSFFDADMKQKLFRPWLRDAVGTDERLAREHLENLHRDVINLDPVSQMMYLDTRASLPDDLLMVADKLSMANSVEARVPYLDHRVVTFVESLPTNMKIRGLKGKYLHKRALAPLVSSRVAYQAKKGFAHPIEGWLRAQLNDFMRGHLLGEGARVHQFFEPSYIRTMVEAHASGRANYLRHLYLLLSFEMWHRRFIRSGG